MLANSMVQYFKSPQLEILDNSARSYYNGVTIFYITTYVNSNKNSINEIAEALLYLHKTNRVCSLYCPDIKHVVFHNRPGYWNYRKNDTDFGSYQRKDEKAYKHFINHINKFKNNAK